jgi:hypothetical protein
MMNLDIGLDNRLITAGEVHGQNRGIGIPNDSNNRQNKLFIMPMITPAPVIGYHQKDNASLERYDPLLQTTTQYNSYCVSCEHGKQSSTTGIAAQHHKQRSCF